MGWSALEACPSSAVTVTVAEPAATGVTVTVVPERPTVAFVSSDELAEYAMTSPSVSVNLPLTSTV